MKKEKRHAFGKDIYLLGVDRDGARCWLEAASWDCSWYWGGGYIETYTNNKSPERSRDISSHTHFDTTFFGKRKCAFDVFKEHFVDTPFSDSEIWKIIELMKSFYTARAYSDMLHTGGAHQTSNPAKNVIQNDIEYQRINTEVIPAIMENLYKIMEGIKND